MLTETKKVLVAMSGGVDSSAAAILLRREGYDVIGVTMRLVQSGASVNRPFAKNCCPDDSAIDAKYVCQRLGVPHYVVDYASQFKRAVIDEFVNEYFSGRTPNPCILCNTFMKWGELVKLGDQLGADFFSTGHYARTDVLGNGDYALLMATDKSKDQSYALWGVNRDMLSRTIFPLGNMSKGRIRGILSEEGIYFAGKRESQDICFIPDNDLPRFLKQAAHESRPKIKSGPIVDTAGRVLGEHRGAMNYTIGQRKGLGISHPTPLYVKDLKIEENVVVVAEDAELGSAGCTVSKLNWLIAPPPAGSVQEFEVKIRYRHRPERAVCEMLEGNVLAINFENSQRAITPGQSAVFYRGERLCGGGIISSGV